MGNIDSNEKPEAAHTMTYTERTRLLNARRNLFPSKTRSWKRWRKIPCIN